MEAGELWNFRFEKKWKKYSKMFLFFSMNRKRNKIFDESSDHQG